MTRTLRRLCLVLPLGLLGLLAGCSSISTAADYDRAADFSHYRTYSWREVDDVPNPLLDQRIHAAVDRALTDKGLTQVEQGGDLTVVYHGRIETQNRVEMWDPAWGYLGGWRWSQPERGITMVREIPVGTLIVDLVDTKTNELVFRGTATGVIDPHRIPEARQEALNTAATRMFSDLPKSAS